MPRTASKPGPRRAVRLLARQGFTLIELLAVMLIISILAVALVPMVSDAVSTSRVTACQRNLSSIGDAIRLYQTKYRRLPTGSGVRFFSELYSRKAMENTRTNAERLTCPEVDLGALAIGTLDWEEWWSDPEAVTGDYSAYAGRDCKRHPLRRVDGQAVLVADDNDGAMNHPTTTNVLYGDNSVQPFELELLKEEGVLVDEEDLLVGPDSQVEDLRVLTLD